MLRNTPWWIGHASMTENYLAQNVNNDEIEKSLIKMRVKEIRGIKIKWKVFCKYITKPSPEAMYMSSTKDSIKMGKMSCNYLIKHCLSPFSLSSLKSEIQSCSSPLLSLLIGSGTCSWYSLSVNALNFNRTSNYS